MNIDCNAFAKSYSEASAQFVSACTLHNLDYDESIRAAICPAGERLATRVARIGRADY